MSGYTPAFSGMYSGSLYGRWPAAAVWASILPLCNKHGAIDMSPQAISGMTGWPMDLLLEGIRQLSEPDPYSRTPDSDGRRLVLIDPARPWGWQVVNHGKYREKARLLAKNASEVQAGRNADRMRDRRRPPATADDPHSDSDSDADSRISVDTSVAPVTGFGPRRESQPSPDGSGPAPGVPIITTKFPKPKRSTATRLPHDFALSPELRDMAERENLPDIEREFERFRDYWRAAAGQNARKHDWPATWRNWCKRAGDELAKQKSAEFRPARADVLRQRMAERERNAKF